MAVDGVWGRAGVSRARNIKPGFFKNELLVELPFEHRLLFIGLWTLADRAGRLEDRPVRIKMEVFPADNVDVNAGLQALHDSGFILRYEAEGCKYIQILAWNKHQNPHVKEAHSTIPAPCENGASTVQDTTKAGASPSDSLIPDSLIPDSKVGESSTHPVDLEGREHPADGVCGKPTAEAQAAMALRKLGCRVTPQNPDLIAAIAEGVTLPALVAMAESYPGKPAGYVISACRRQRAESASPTPTARAGPPGKPPIAQQFADKTYEGTPDDQLPAHLRSDAA